MPTECQNGKPLYTQTPQSDPGSVAEALLRQQTFTRAQVAWLMAQAMRWGYENRVNEENAAYPPAPYFIAGKFITGEERQTRREAWYASARLPRPGDFKGVGVPTEQAAA